MSLLFLTKKIRTGIFFLEKKVFGAPKDVDWHVTAHIFQDI